MVSNLVVEIAIYNFDLFRSALRSTFARMRSKRQALRLANALNQYLSLCPAAHSGLILKRRVIRTSLKIDLPDMPLCRLLSSTTMWRT